MSQRDHDLLGPGCSNLPTSFDVAALAHVSQTTVSRALRGDTCISTATRERVARAAERLGYIPDTRGIRLRQSSVGTIAVVLLFPDGGNRKSLNPFYYEIVSAVEAAAASRNVAILLSGQSDLASLRGDFERRREADGVIVIGAAANRKAWNFFAQLRRGGANIVSWGSPDDELPTIRSDNLEAGRLAAEHLISTGCRRLAFIGPGWQMQKAFRLRRDGFLLELERHGLPDCSLEVAAAAGDRHEQGEAAIERLLAAGSGLDGVFAASDALAAGAMNGLIRKGRRIPDDVAVVGVDGSSNARHSVPPLTTIEQDVALAGQQLIDAILERHSDPERHVKRFVPVRLVVRESSRSRQT